jgi:hypothetical protein
LSRLRSSLDSGTRIWRERGGGGRRRGGGQAC